MYYLLGIYVLLASINSIGLNKAKIGEKSSVFNFNLISSIVWCVILFLVNGCTVTLEPGVFLWG